jgi:hypothetical protein
MFRKAIKYFTLKNQVNADGSSYDVIVGPRVGRTTSKEQYAFMYDTTILLLQRKLSIKIYTIYMSHIIIVLSMLIRSLIKLTC